MIAEDRAPMIKQPEVGATYDAFLNKPEVIDLQNHHHHLSIMVTLYITIIINNRCAYCVYESVCSTPNQ